MDHHRFVCLTSFQIPNRCSCGLIYWYTAKCNCGRSHIRSVNYKVQVEQNCKGNCKKAKKWVWDHQSTTVET